MHLTKLVSVLKAFDEPTIKDFKEFVHCEYFKVPVSAVRLFDYLEKQYPVFRESRLNPDVIAGKVKELGAAGKQAKAGTELLKAIDNYIAMNDCRENEWNNAMHRLNGFKKLHLFEQFTKEHVRLQEELEEQTEQNVDAFFYKHQFTEIYFSGFDGKLDRTKHNDLMPVLKTLDEYYAIKKLRYLCEALNRKQVLGIDYSGDHIQRLLDILKPYDNEKYPYVHIFVNVFKMLSAESYEDSQYPYLLIKKIAADYDKENLPTAISESVNYALNRCLFWSNQGVEEAGQEYLWWIDFKMRWGILLQNGKLTPITFRNVVASAALYGKRADWMRQFIRVYSQNLPDEDRDTNVSFALGLYFYCMKDYGGAIRYFLNAQAKEEVVFNAIIRRWQWMATYEANPEETDLLMNQLLAFEKYMQRNKDDFHYYKPVFTAFISYAKKLLSSLLKSELAATLEALNIEPHFSGKKWLFEQFTLQIQKSRNPGERAFL
ncbi:MAG TPA: hypothetical protein VG603_08350 [Chitinophagales bacterium]|nr:hypothetical protein [Chitinophagales bacterium]